MIADTPPIDILLYIALSEEFNDLSDELIDELGDGFMPRELNDIALTVFCGKVYSQALKKDFQLAVVPAGKMGNTRSAGVTSAILTELPAHNVVVTGIAGSLSNDLQPGDVFIPDCVDEYLANSATKGRRKIWTFETSGNQMSTTPRLLNRFQVFRRTQKVFYDRWSQDCAARFAPLIEGEIQAAMTKAGLDIRPEIKLFAGDDRKLASGPAVGKGKAFVDWITQKADRKAAAMEMESAGVYDAAQIRTPAPRVIAIRGISDFADERKELIEKAAKDQFRAVSAKNALSLLLHGIQAGLFEKDGLRAGGSDIYSTQFDGQDNSIQRHLDKFQQTPSIRNIFVSHQVIPLHEIYVEVGVSESDIEYEENLKYLTRETHLLLALKHRFQERQKRKESCFFAGWFR